MLSLFTHLAAFALGCLVGAGSLAWVIARDKQSLYVDRKQADVLKAAREIA